MSDDCHRTTHHHPPYHKYLARIWIMSPGDLLFQTLDTFAVMSKQIVRKQKVFNKLERKRFQRKFCNYNSFCSLPLNITIHPVNVHNNKSFDAFGTMYQGGVYGNNIQRSRWKEKRY